MIGSLTVKPLLAGAAVLAVLLGIQTVRLSLAHKDVAVAEAAVETERAKVVAAITERDAYNLALVNAHDVAGGWETVAEERLVMLVECQVERDRLDHDIQAGIVAAQAEAERAKRALRDWMAKYDAERNTPGCLAASAAFDDACPLTDY